MFALDPEMPEDVSDLLQAAALLEVSEYRVFELAYTAWFSTARELPDKKVLERFFFAYLYRDRIPPWVRAYTREIVRRADAGTFDPADYGIVYAPPTRTMIYLGIRYTFWTVLTLVFIIASAQVVTVPEGCYFPPCY
jgi:hypothetical protein